MLDDMVDIFGGCSDNQRTRRSLSATSQQLLSDQHNGLPVWVRAPVRGHEFYSGLSRAKLYELASLGSIDSRSLRQPGQVKGTRVFRLQSILTYIDGRN